MRHEPNPPQFERIGSRALVLGGGFAGLLVARVLADHFERVDIIERDAEPQGDEVRKGVPQGAHAHILMQGGTEAIERLMPGFVAELRADGLRAVDFARDVAWKQFGHWKSRAPRGPVVLAQSRPALDRRLRERVLARRSIRVLWQHAALGLRFEPDGRKLTGLEVRTADGERRTLDADLVVDASGVGSKLPGWLAEAGWQRPEEETIDLGLAYTTGIFRRPERERWDWQMLIVSPQPGRTVRGGMILPIDEHHWSVSLSGYGGDHAPTDAAGFVEFARTLASSSLAHAVLRATQVGEIRRFVIAKQRRLRYDRIALPEGLVVLGDAVCRVDPIFGHGMSSAAFQVEALARLLRARRRRRRPLVGLAGSYQRRVRHISEVPWRLAAGYRATAQGASGGGRRRVWMAILGQLRRVAEAGADPVAHQALLEINHLVSSPVTLFRPKVVGALLLGRVRPIHESLVRRWAARRISSASAGR